MIILDKYSADAVPLIVWHNIEIWFVVKQHYVTLTANRCFEKQNLTMHGHTLHETAYFTEKMSSGFASDVLQLLCLNSVVHGGS